MVGFAENVELIAELFEKKSEVVLVGCGGEFPVDIDAIEEIGCRDAWGDVAVDEEVDAGSGQLLAQRVSAGSVGKTCGIGAGGTAERNHDFEIGVELFELKQGGEVAV